ncbi:hypothetical protein CLV55_101100 [Flavobacterium aciduliphilum]|uniref:Uncharacterized protein n=1 Tax=Flavobacterium aciduliphilum TaxID=1101402 RepID=A0A328YRJ2_9FLAO|nr:hypothetical protein CLV55_101100 [Flavobacterium aciduliphilum]
MIKYLYHYLYFRLYKFAKKVGTVDATWTAMLLISALLFFNFAPMIFYFINIKKISFPKFFGSILIGFICLFNFFIFIYKDKCFYIIKDYEKETDREKIISTIVVITYIVLTLVISH